MAIACPTVLAFDQEDFDRQMNNVKFASRIQVDFMDGEFVETKSISLSDAWWSETAKADLHLMYKHPQNHIETIIQKKPSLVIIHAEAEVDHVDFAANMHRHSIKAGICVLPETSIESIKDKLANFEHLLIFAGTLGHHGGVADFDQLSKAKEAKAVKHDIEVGWDGGVNDQTAKRIIDGGVDVISAGGFIQKAEDPQAAYKTLVELVS